MELVSVILPVYNEEKYIEQSLRAIINQNNTNPMEIFVVDGNSTDSTLEIVGCIQHDNPNIQIINNPKKIVPYGMNAALRQAKGNIVVRVDGHCVIAPDYIKTCMMHLAQDGVDGVGGPMETIGEDLLSDTIALAMSSKFGVGNSAFRTTSERMMEVDTVPFPAYTRDIIERVGFYDEELVRNQDDEYNYRIRALGGKLLLAEDVRSKYYSRGSIKKLWRQFFQYGFYKVRVLQKHPRQMSLRQFIPLLFVLGLLFSALLALFTVWGGIILGLFVGSYFLANLLATLFLVLKNDMKHILMLPLAFAAMHFGYGCGFLVGLFKFWNRWGDKKGGTPEQ